ncbi:Gfo/Idh/MocA family protein [Pelagicoccus mobilis]|uniref:Gfo/Idh/MocA family oxidoreductase n=1 Tax=Pelagicoccus mobilis TaxID=415221 RepID=A0A934RXT3_9BACT|nr:Gfo/Idh/MocA family oxidoreductase [Pelagicoccus mobilis]MBK1877440.1 Gfo/Idh/MocA family oxidoreductase [Pelagicoccus mobilis]
MNTNRTRRDFLKAAAVAAIGMPTIIPASALGKNGTVAPSNRIVVGGIGLGGRGRGVLAGFFKHKDSQFVAIADPQKKRREIVKRMTDRQYGNSDCVTYDDMSGILERDDIDSVLIATGDRWHTTASILAARAGKDIYCEKPCAMNIQECQELDDEITKHKRVFQAGTQRRSVPNFKLAVDLAREGKLGQVTEVHAGILKLQEYLEPLPAEPEPDPSEINWDKWLGPAPWLPFNEAYCRGRWRNHKGLYSGWRLPEWGTHTIDLCQWAADADGTTPIEFEAVSDSLIHAKYENGIKLVLRLSSGEGVGEWIKGMGSCPVRFVGDEAWVEAGDFQKLEASNPKLIENKNYDQLRGTDPVTHVRNFLDCVKTREQPVCNSTAVRYGHMACFAAAISWKLGRKVRFDPVKERFIGDRKANKMRTYKRRAPYRV